MGFEKRIKKDKLITTLKITNGLRLQRTTGSNKDYLSFNKKTKIKRNDSKLTLDAFISIGEEKYRPGNYIRFIWYNHSEMKGPGEYYKNEVCGCIDNLIFNEDENWFAFILEPSHCREYGTRNSFTKEGHLYDPQHITNAEKLSEEEYKRLITNL